MKGMIFLPVALFTNMKEITKYFASNIFSLFLKTSHFSSLILWNVHIWE